MRMHLAWLGLATCLMGSAATAAPTQQFNLSCIQEGGPAPLSQDLTIDLDRMIWCRNPDCLRSLAPIALLTPGEIRLIQDDNGNLMTLNRVTGAFRFLQVPIQMFANPRVDIRGSCRVMPYTPIPPNKF